MRFARIVAALGALSALSLFSTASSGATAAQQLQDSIDHIVVVMQENRSFDEYLGMLKAYDPTLDVEALPPDATNPNPSGGPPVKVFHQTLLCDSDDVSHSWPGSHNQWNNGANDGFTTTNVVSGLDPSGRRAMGYYTEQEIPYYYDLYSTFAIGDRYYSSLLGPTYPNRFYLLAGGSWIDSDRVEAETENRLPMSPDDFKGVSIFNRLDDAGISWKVYGGEPVLTFANEFAFARNHVPPAVLNLNQYFVDAANGTLPQVTFIDPIFIASKNVQSDEHPVANIQVGQKHVHDVVDALFNSPQWSSSALFLTYDEHGGYYDHVSPPPAPLPYPDPGNPGQDLHPPAGSHAAIGTFDRYGFRVPVAVVSPFAKPHSVSHVTHDHTSILRFIETRFNLPALTNRTALADPMLEFFDFANPAFMTPPTLINPTVDMNRPECEEAVPDADGDGDGDPFDSCPALANADQADYDADGRGDPCDSDDDGDLVADSAESSCGGTVLDHTRRPERVDGPFAGTDDDGDTQVDEPLPAGSAGLDCDGDGYTGAAEAHVFSNLGGQNQDACGNNGWPSELTTGGPSANAITLTDLSSFVAPAPRKLDKDPGEPGYDVRWDVVVGGTVPKDINLQDMAALVAASTGSPPMLDGKKAFGGPVCPWPP